MSVLYFQKGKNMAKQQIKINDFKLLLQSLKAFAKMSSSAKLTFNSEGLTIYGKNPFARGEFQTNAAISEKDPIEFCILDLSMFLKVLGTVWEVHEEDFSDIELWFDFPFVKIESGKFKTKLATCKEEVIQNTISQKIKAQLNPVFSFKTSTKQIKYVNSHSYIVSDVDSARVYLSTEPTMENNVVYARIGNDANELNNSMTLKLGLVTFGNLNNRTLILNFDRLNILNVVDSEEIEVQLMDKNVLMNMVRLDGNSDYSTVFKIYTSLLAN